MSTLIVIPASLASSRLPSKPMQYLGDKTLLQRTYEQAIQCEKASAVVVASDDEAVLSFCRAQEIEYHETRECRNGTHRCARTSVRYPQYDFVVNWQVDEPCVEPGHVDALIKEAEKRNAAVHTLIGPCNDEHRSNLNSVKAVTNSKNTRAIYFTRQPVPCAWLHIGVYAFDRETLLELKDIEQCDLAKGEGLEQLDWVNEGYSVKTIQTGASPISINTTEDVEAWQRRYRQSGAST